MVVSSDSRRFLLEDRMLVATISKISVVNRCNLDSQMLLRLQPLERAARRLKPRGRYVKITGKEGEGAYPYLLMLCKRRGLPREPSDCVARARISGCRWPLAGRWFFIFILLKIWLTTNLLSWCRRAIASLLGAGVIVVVCCRTNAWITTSQCMPVEWPTEERQQLRKDSSVSSK